jgi:hypothetical protein
MLASPRGLSQLATSFIACWRQGIHTYALSSLTIKLTPQHRVVFKIVVFLLRPTQHRTQTTEAVPPEAGWMFCNL